MTNRVAKKAMVRYGWVEDEHFDPWWGKYTLLHYRKPPYAGNFVRVKIAIVRKSKRIGGR